MAVYFKNEVIKDDDELYRYTVNEDEINMRNQNMIKRVKNTQYYFTFVNPQLGFFRDDMLLPDNGMTWCFHNYGYRTILTTLSSVKYTILKKEAKCPFYGFKLIKSLKEYNVYENTYALPMTYVYDSYITNDEVKEKNPIDKEELMLKTAILDKPIDYKKFRDVVSTNSEIYYHIDNITEDIDFDEIKKVIDVKEDSQSVLVSFLPIENAEMYVVLKGVKIKNNDKYIGFAGVTVDGRVVYLINHLATNWSFDKEDYVFNMGYSDIINMLALTFDGPNEYKYDDLYIDYIPMDDYEKYISDRKDMKLNQYKILNDEYNFDIDVDSSKILCVAVPYSSGFSATINGEEKEVLKVNNKNIGIMLNAGNNKVKLKYNTPYGKEGKKLSLIGIVLLILTILITEMRRRKIKIPNIFSKISPIFKKVIGKIKDIKIIKSNEYI